MGCSIDAKKQLAEERGYERMWNAHCCQHGIIDDDFCTVLQNLLDNAIESMDREKAGRLQWRKRAVDGGVLRGRILQLKFPAPFITSWSSV